MTLVTRKKRSLEKKVMKCDIHRSKKKKQFCVWTTFSIGKHNTYKIFKDKETKLEEILCMLEKGTMLTLTTYFKVIEIDDVYPLFCVAFISLPTVEGED